MSEFSGRNDKPSPYVKGDAIDGKYRVEGVLGEGSFGWVYLCTHVRVKALSYAVKVLKAEHTTDVETVARFHREAETVASLRSKHSVRVTDYGVAQEGLPYIVMEFVDGLSIGEMLSRGGPFDDGEVLELSLHVLRALDEAHRCGIVHRDLKPDNVIVVQDPDTRQPVARVLDFGLAKILEPENFQIRPEETAAGLVLCTARYAAPDLLKGNPSAQSDIYALGISMIEMIDGRPPYRGDDFYTVAAKHIDPKPVPLGERVQDSILLPIIQKATAKPLVERYTTAMQMVADLEAVQTAKRAAGGDAYFDTVSASVRARIATTSPGSVITPPKHNMAMVSIIAALVGAVVAVLLLLRTGPDLPADTIADSPEALPAAAAAPPLGVEAASTGQVEELARRHATLEARLTRDRARRVAAGLSVLPGSGDETDEASDTTANTVAPPRDDPSPRREVRREERRDPPRDEPPEEGDEDDNLFGGIRTIGGP